MQLRNPDHNRRWGSNVIAAATGMVLLAFALFVLVTGDNPLERLRAEILVGAAALTFGTVLLIWVASDWTEWIGNETVNMTVGVVASLIAIAAFAQDIEAGAARQPPPLSSR
jgi:ammonia channel protein AmtB